MRYLLLAFLAVGLASPAGAATWQNPCGTVSTKHTITGNGAKACWTFTSADGVIASNAFTVTTETALVCFDPDTLTTDIGGGTVSVRRYPAGSKPAANPERQAVSLGGANGNATLDGTPGAAVTQNACIRISPGVYDILVGVGCTAGDACRVTIEGEGGNP